MIPCGRKTRMPAAGAIASGISTPGKIGGCGKCPWKSGSFTETFFRATMRLPASNSFTRSISRKGKRCGRCAMTSLTFISLMFFSLAAKPRRAACPRLVLVHRVDAGIGAGLQDRARDEGAGRDVDMVDDAQVAEDHGG